LESDFSFNDDNKQDEKEKIVFSKLRDKYNFYPRQENLPEEVFISRDPFAATLKTNKTKSNFFQSMSLEKNSKSVDKPNLKKQQSSQSKIFSKTGVSFLPKQTTYSKKDSLPLITNVKTVSSIRTKSMDLSKMKKKESLDKARKVLDRINLKMGK